MNEDEQNPEMNEQIRHFSIIADHSALPKKTVDQDDVDLAYQESWGNGTKLGNGLVCGFDMEESISPVLFRTHRFH